MKRKLQLQICLILCMAMFAGIASAQGDYLPVKNNWGVTFGANGLNTLGWDAHTAPSGSLLFRYYMKDCASYRLGFNPYINRTFNTIDLGDQFQESKVTDKGLGLSLGYQNNFIGTNRINPYAGADIFMDLWRTNSNTFTYTVDDDDVEDPDGPWSETSIIGAKTKAFGLRPFIGFEYFVVPKLSIGAEAGYNLRYESTGPAKITTTIFDGEDEETTETEGLSSNGFNMGGQGSALLTFSYYFMKRCCEDEMMD